jgi:hypothetical protein
MALQSTARTRFVRRTQLSPTEYHKNFYKLDQDTIAIVSSVEADRVTRQMSKIYLRLVNAPKGYWERDGVLRFGGAEREGEWVTAWEQLVSLLGVASATARKALMWMSEQGVLGYSAHKNGAGIRIFMNRASSSIGRKPGHDQKNLRLVHTSSSEPRTSTVDTPFKDSYAVREISDTDINPRPPKSGVPESEASCHKEPPDRELPSTNSSPVPAPASDLQTGGLLAHGSYLGAEMLVKQLTREIVPHVKAAAAFEHERTREWFQAHALPKAIRVSQAVAYDVLRSYGVINEPRSRNGKGSLHSNAEVGRQTISQAESHRLSDEEVADYAETCAALLLAQGESIERTLSEMSVEAGGLLLAEDRARVRAQAEALLLECEAEGKGR